jgi:polysaccharide export outer membrane protein
MTRIWILFAISILILSGCVPARKLVYLQEGDELKKRKKIPKDSVLRSHTLNIQEYRIQPLDLLSINFETLNENDAFDFLGKLSPQNRGGGGGGGVAAAAAVNGILVNKEGEIEYAVLGKIKVGGLTLFEAQDTIRSIAAQYVADVIVRVKMLNFRFTVLGEVNGERTVQSNNTRLTMMEAIGLSGGFGELADRSTVKVVRQNGEAVEVYYLNLLKEEFVESPYYFVQQNDVIIVPPLKQRTFRRYWISNLGIITATISFAALMVSLFKE